VGCQFWFLSSFGTAAQAGCNSRCSCRSFRKT
jgi:hypothetical protein